MIGNNVKPKLDPDYQAGVMITGFHYHIHLGQAFVASYRVPDGSTIADGASLDILIRTGSTKKPHITFHRDTTGDTDIDFFRSPDIATVGTATKIMNMKDGGPVPETLFYYGPTFGAGGVGTSSFEELESGGTGGQASGSEGVFDEQELDLNSDYVYRITNRSGQPQRMGWFSRFYEVKES